MNQLKNKLNIVLLTFQIMYTEFQIWIIKQFINLSNEMKT